MRRSVAVLTFVLGLVLASSIVAVAATSSAKKTSAKACVTSKGQLRLIGKKSCGKGTSAITLNAVGPQGAAGAQGPSGSQGAQGAAGAKGNPGSKGDKGDTGTPDTSSFFTKTESDARYARSGDHIDIPGQDFSPVDSATQWAYANYFGIYEKSATTRQFMVTGLQSLPNGATVTSVDFFLTHNVSGPAATVNLSHGTPTVGSTNGAESVVALAPRSDLDPGIVKVTVTPSGGYTPSGDEVPLLFWEPGTVGNGDILWSARVHYTVG